MHTSDKFCFLNIISIFILQGSNVDTSSQETSNTDLQKQGTIAATTGGKQIQVPPAVTTTTQQSSFNPINPIQAFNFPPFNTPPPLVQQSMGFSAFGNQQFSMSQQPPYGIQQGMFSNQSLFPGMGLMGANQPSGLGMMGTPPLMMNMNAASNLSKTPSADDVAKKENTLEQNSIVSSCLAVKSNFMRFYENRLVKE